MMASLKLPKIGQKMTIVSVKSKFCEPEKIFRLAERKLATLFALINLK